ncbi:Peroxidase [Parasponia andersonii]|uniref:Peroxidase n=1 Tax=Parasponia andersonii TaxID=3476 RepID=A0A2P5DYH7_PARAD|nr:Peroxidase [Parasponia andersonii]
MSSLCLISSKGYSFTCASSVALLLLLLLSATTCKAQLSSTFYDDTCPNALATIRTSIESAVSQETRMAASLIRLHFHDCFVQGCDASVLLENSSSITSEKGAIQNSGSLRGENVIEEAKSQVESICPGIVSCADILAVAARDASVAVGGPSWTVKLGRRDSTTANLDEARTDLPLFTASLSELISLFDRKGSHTIGQARCVTFRDRIYNNASDIDADFAGNLRSGCPQSGGDSNLAPLDLVTPNSFDNNYFTNLIEKKGLLESDQILFSGGSTDSVVTEYNNNPSTFSSDFASAMVKMADIQPITGSAGQIRTICSAVN